MPYNIDVKSYTFHSRSHDNAYFENFLKIKEGN